MKKCAGFTYCGTKLFNNLPNEIRESQDINCPIVVNIFYKINPFSFYFHFSDPLFLTPIVYIKIIFFLQQGLNQQKQTDLLNYEYAICTYIFGDFVFEKLGFLFS